ncbi:MAG: hypothetical protein HY457_00120 [Parcubacteria group bacterium]|nr:hypothetical protein [Parcubacteria group bacterium]
MTNVITEWGSWLSLVNTLFILFAFVMWSTWGWKNTLIKVLWGVLTLANAVFTLHYFGFIVKIGA